ncbi:uncharacterized protein LOC143885400 [Tasmannia lanceolata]|uniref:uncharacterized protein LOC143885400 n=1 Tax=Tasmannia lanceolata TaxID=3420 RepID=UPI004063D070
MGVEYETKGKKQVEVHYVNSGVPSVVNESFEGYYVEHGDLSLEEVLLDQESVYQSFQTNTGNGTDKASASTGPNTNRDQSSGERRIVIKEGESSQVHNMQSQLALDEALAKALQELELAGTSFTETTRTEAETTPSPSSTVNREVNSTDTTTLAARQDNLDPDNMTYEELQSLGEVIGTESKGLSDELISYLPSFKYKTGLFSRKDKHEECVICCMAYKNRDTLITLPCKHQYHSKCVIQWLKLNKACPVCNEEVFGS